MCAATHGSSTQRRRCGSMASAILLRRIRGAVFVGKRASQKDIVAVRIRPDLASAQLVTAIRHFNDRTALMLDPVELNRLSSTEPIGDNDFPLTWFSSESTRTRRGEVVEWLALATDKNIENKVKAFGKIRLSMKSNIGSQNIRRAWGERAQGTDLPVAV